MKSEKVAVRVGERELMLSNLGKVLYPEAGFSKAQVIDYYTRIAPVLLPHLAGRALTRKRYPDGVESSAFFEKNAPSHTPEWVRTVRLPTPGSTKQRETTNFVVGEDLATLVWLANLATLELHTPMWRVGSGPDLLVFDLDPGPPATAVECCAVALRVRGVLAEDGLTAYPKTSGSKGLQLYVALDGTQPWQDVHGYARRVAERLEREQPDLVVSNMRKTLRTGKVLVDWSQNNGAKTTVTVYSLRARPWPTVSTPVTWAEVEACSTPEDLRHLSHDVLARVEAHGDLFAPLLAPGPPLPAPVPPVSR